MACRPYLARRQAGRPYLARMIYHFNRPTRYTYAMRIIGKQNRNKIELDPVIAYRRRRRLDLMLRAVNPARPSSVTCGTHAEFQRLDELRMIEVARRVNDPSVRGIKPVIEPLKNK